MKVIYEEYPVQKLKKNCIIVEHYGDHEKVIEDAWNIMKYFLDTHNVLPNDSYYFKSDVEYNRLRRFDFSRIFIPFDFEDSEKIRELSSVLVEMDVPSYAIDWENKKVRGMKIGKFIRKNLIKGFEDNQQIIKAIDKQLSELLDYTRNGWLVISSNPCDILMPNHGNFLTCLSPDGEYVSGVLSYLATPNLIQIYTTLRDTPGEYNLFWKVYRAYAFLGRKDKFLGIINFYPNITVAESEKVFETVFKYFFPNQEFYTIRFLEKEVVEKIANHLERCACFTYFDGIYMANKKHYEELTENYNISQPKCYACGDYFTAESFIVCSDCCFYNPSVNLYYCYECGMPIPEGAAYIKDYDIAYCPYCFEELFQECSYCGEIYRKDLLTEVDGGDSMACSSCLEERCIKCVKCDAWIDDCCEHVEELEGYLCLECYGKYIKEEAVNG